jgi:hypothetical protein
MLKMPFNSGEAFHRSTLRCGSQQSLSHETDEADYGRSLVFCRPATVSPYPPCAAGRWLYLCVNRCSKLNVVGKELGKLRLLTARQYIDHTGRGFIVRLPSVVPLRTIQIIPPWTTAEVTTS